MTRTIDEIDPTRPVTLWPCIYDAGTSTARTPAGFRALILKGAAVPLFLARATECRPAFEANLQELSTDSAGHPLLTTWYALLTFRDGFCLPAARGESGPARRLMAQIASHTAAWEAAGVHTVDITGYRARVAPR